MNKIIIVVTGATGSIYAKVLLDKLFLIKFQWSAIGIVIIDNAKIVWKTELKKMDMINTMLNTTTKIILQLHLYKDGHNSLNEYGNNYTGGWNYLPANNFILIVG